jgi:hypothetical protein
VARARIKAAKLQFLRDQSALQLAGDVKPPVDFASATPFPSTQISHALYTTPDDAQARPTAIAGRT